MYGFATKPHNFWKVEKLKNMKSFFENYFSKHNMDPLVADNWYSLSTINFRGIKVNNNNNSNNFISFFTIWLYTISINYIYFCIFCFFFIINI